PDERLRLRRAVRASRPPRGQGRYRRSGARERRALAGARGRRQAPPRSAERRLAAARDQPAGRGVRDPRACALRSDPRRAPQLEMSRAVVLFTRDLRVHDHAALSSAIEEADEIVPLFVFDEALARVHRAAARHAFLLGSLAVLRESLRSRGGDLFLRSGDPVEQTLRVARATDTDAVFLGADVSAYAKRRQERLALACLGERIGLRIENTVAAVPWCELTPAARDHYRVFTPYWRRWRETPLPEPLAAPGRVRVPTDLPRGQLPSPTKPLDGGERAARRRLDEWLGDGLHDYGSGRNGLAGNGTSRLSPFLHFGCVSANEVVTRARREGSTADEFVRQLCWRDFYLQLLAANPSTATLDLHPRERPWRDNE